VAINGKAKGNRLERRCVNFLEGRGYACTKSGGSLGVWDIVAISPEQILLIQVKANRKPRKPERLKMQAFRAPPNCTKQLWIYEDGFPNAPIITEVKDAD